MDSPQCKQNIRSVAQPGSASGLGPEGPRFESLYSDQFHPCSIMDNTLGYELRNCGSIPCRGTIKYFMKHSCAYCGSEDTKVVTYTFKPATGPFVKGFKKNACNVCKSETVPMDLVDHNVKLYNNSKHVAKHKRIMKTVV